MANEKLKEILGLFSEQFPKAVFQFSYSLHFKRWVMFVNDFETYMSKDFKEVSELIREHTDISFFSVCLKHPKKNDEYKIFISK